VSPSASAANLADIPALRHHLIAILPQRRKGVPVALNLPDASGRIGLFPVENFPKRAHEFQAWLRWRLQKEWGDIPKDARLAHRIGHAKDSWTGKVQPYVLAMMLEEQIIGQYEALCQDCDLLPIHIGLSSILLLNVAQPLIAHETPPGDEAFLLAILHNSFAFFALRSDCPVFLRIKPWCYRLSSTNPQHALFEEVLATLQAYLTGRPGKGGRTLFVLDDRRSFSAGTRWHIDTEDAEGIQVHAIDLEPALMRRVAGRTPNLSLSNALAIATLI